MGFKKLEADLAKSKENHEIHQDIIESIQTLRLRANKSSLAYEYLENAVTYFKNNDQITEKLFHIKEQLILQSKIQRKNLNFEISSKPFLSEWSNKVVSDFVSELELRAVDDNDLKKLNKLIESEEKKFERNTFSNSSYRDYVEKNIDINWTLESLPALNLDIHKFFYIFTKRYINLLEKKYSNEEIQEMHKNFSSWLNISKKDLESLLINIFLEEYPELKEFDYKFEVKINDWKKTKTIKHDSNVIVFLSQLIEVNKNNETEKEDKEIEKKVTRKKENKKPAKVEAIKNDSLNLIEYISKNWLPKESEKILKTLITSNIKWLSLTEWGKRIHFTEEFIRKHEKELIHNMKIAITIILWIESKWKNINNYNWSSAKWYYQFMTGNFNRYSRNSLEQRRKSGDFCSYETALRRAYMKIAGFNNKDKMYMPTTKLLQVDKLKNYDENRHKDVPEWIINAYNSTPLDPKNLNYEQQTSLFLYDIFENKKSYKNRLLHNVNSDEIIWLVLLWNSRWIKQLYNIFHHTAPDAPTSEETNSAMNIYKWWLKIINA